MPHCDIMPHCDKMPHCDIMPHCDKMPQLHRFSWTAIEYSMVHSEGAVSTAPDLF